MPLAEAGLIPAQPFSDAELQSAVSSLIGRLVMELSRFELNLDLCLRHLVGGSEPVLLNPLIERLSLKAKMDALREVIARRHAGRKALHSADWRHRRDTARCTAAPCDCPACRASRR